MCTTAPDDEYPGSVTAGFISMDRFLQNIVPICCLPFDRIGVWHPGMTLDAGARSPRHNPFQLPDHPQEPMTHPWHTSRAVDNLADRKPSEKSELPTFFEANGRIG
jgi:hypothetical protein